MNKKSSQTPENQDDILQAFENAKEEQMDLFENEDKSGPEDAHWAADPALIGRNRPEEQQEQESQQKQEETKWYTGYDGIQYTEEEWLSPAVYNGPTRKEVEGWKEKHAFVYFTPFDSEVYVWRVLRRPEYREIIRDQTLTALDREEIFTERCVLFPYDFSLEKIKKSRAGVASLLSEMIMDKSGFVAQSAPIKL